MRFALLLVALSACAQEGVIVENGESGSWTRSDTTGETVRVEGYLYNYSNNTTSGEVAALWANNVKIIMYTPGGGNRIEFLQADRSGATICQANLTNFPNAIVFRYQFDSTVGSYGQSTCEVWSPDGTNYNLHTVSYTGTVSYTFGNGQIATRNNNTTWMFLRVYSSLVAVGGRIPLPTDTVADDVDFTFNSTLNDRSGNARHITFSGGTASYESISPAPVIAVAKRYAAPFWSDAPSCRAGNPCQFNAGDSFTMSETSNSLTYFWQVLTRPMGAVTRLDSHTSATPSITGMTFGEYVVQLQVTDAGGTKALDTVTVGAVATDANGVVVQANSNVEVLFGPMIAFGKNPWGYEDERHFTGSALNYVSYQAPDANGYSTANPSWVNPGAGTIAYKMNGLGTTGNPVTTLSSGINATDTSITVADASALDLTGLPGTPVRICIASSGSTIPCDYYTAHEEIRICSVSGNVLTVCFDGRGHGDQGNFGYQYATSWGSGSKVGQFRVTGTSTQFLANAAAPICPAGIGPAGRIIYTTGTITLTAGSTSITGNGTTWNSANGVTGSKSVWVRASATYSSGSPFVFWARADTVNSTTSITLDRAFPASGDTGSYSYQIILSDNRWWGLGYLRNTDGGATQHLAQASGCEGETGAYAKAIFDLPESGNSISGRNYTFQDGLGLRSAFGPNFYGAGLAHRALHYRSGLTSPLTAANWMDNNWLKSPEVARAGGSALLYGGAAIGALANVILNPNATITWGDVENYIQTGASTAGAGCNSLDSRDSGYLYAMVALGALYDPNSTRSTTWNNAMATILTRQQNCKQADNSWSNGFYFNATGPQVTLTNGSAVGTGTGFTADNTGCKVSSTGSGSATNGSATITTGGSIPSGGALIAITGVLSGQPYTGFYNYSGSGSSVTISVLWPGDTGSITWAVQSGSLATWLVTIATNNDDTANLGKNWVCTLDSSTQITLQRNWDGANGTYGMYYGNLAGHGQQPYMLGILTNLFHWGSLVANPTTASGFAALKPLAADWFYTTGYDPGTKGSHYGRKFGACEPYTTAPASPQFTFRNIECTYGDDPGATRAGRVLNAESNSLIRAKYEAVTNSTIRDWADTVYGAAFGHPSYTTGGVYSDSLYVTDEINNVSLGAYKWLGFFFGMGMSHQWPAVRLGGVAAAQNRTLYVAASIASIPNATKYRVTATAPSGAIVTNTCSSSPCSITVDARQGAWELQIAYLSAADAVLASGEKWTQEVN